MAQNDLLVSIKADDGALQAALKRSTQSLQDFTNICNKVKGTFNQLTQAFQTVQSTVSLAQVAWGNIKKFVETFQMQCILARLELTHMGVGFTSLKVCMMGVQGTFSILMQSLNAAIASNPIGWIMIGVQAVCALCNAFKTCQKEAFDAAKEMEEFNNSMSDLASEHDVYAKKTRAIEGTFTTAIPF